MRYTSVLALMLAVAVLVAIMTVTAVPHSPNLAAAEAVNYRPTLWKVY